MPTGRRDFLINAGAALSGGYLSRVAGEDRRWIAAVTEAETGESTDTTADGATGDAGTASTVDSFDVEFSLSSGERRSWSFEYEAETTLTYDLIVRWGDAEPGADILLFDDAEEYRAYLDDYRARYIATGSVFGAANIDVRSLTVPPGTYHLVVDNNDWRKGFADSLGTSNNVDGSTEVPANSSDGSDTLGIEFSFTATQ